MYNNCNKKTIVTMTFKNVKKTRPIPEGVNNRNQNVQIFLVFFEVTKQNKRKIGNIYSKYLCNNM